ncbi:MAG: hypothetical protein CVV44_18370 [Spirochaetae bacterium HGW-Spirochaetae-1]|nr:MAG: hypothetical protein CVV44_18370 [Spirochaetae bacterium HGW-Spirochaetae-1]
MKRTIALISIALLTGFFSCSKEQVDEYAMITFMLGDVLKNNIAVEIGSLIKEKDIIVTGADSFCDVRIGGSIIRIKEKSNATISNLMRKGDMEDTTVGLGVGKMLCKPKKLLKSEKFIVKTPTAVAAVRGTTFTIEADAMKTTRIKVFNGKVKVARRIKQLEESMDRVLEAAPAIEKERKIVITEKEVTKAEAAVEKILAAETAKAPEEAITAVILQARNEVVISDKKIEKFAVEDFQKDNKEMIEVKVKPVEVIREIATVIKQEKEMPKPDGRLLVTRYEIYFIKNGKVLWEGKVVENPIKKDDKIYIASGDYVYCASTEGPVLWRKNIENEGKLELKEDKLAVFTSKGTKNLDLDTGEQL